MSSQSSARARHPSAALLTALLLAGCHASARPAISPRPAEAPPVALARSLDAILEAAPLSRGYWGAEVRSLDHDDTLYARNADRLLMPASTMKILTLAAAGERLGWDFRFETRLLASGPIADGVLDGDLVVVGSGDPTILDRDGSASRLFADWAAQLRSAGILAIRGRLVGDDRAFRGTGLGNGWAWDDLASGYAAAVSALQFNDNIAGLLFTPGAAAGASAAVAIDPSGTDLTIVNRVVTGAPDSRAVVVARRLPGSSRLEIEGSVPLGGPAVARTVSVDNPTLFFVTALRDALTANGILVMGPAVDIDEIEPPDDAPARTLLVHHSAPLSEMAVTMMKLSQNLYAETLLAVMGRQTGMPTAAAGVGVVRTTLEAWGVPASAVIQVDGSGLSRYDYVSAAAIVAVLAHVNRDDAARTVFAAALPLAGHDGTLEARLVDTPAGGTVLAKTGSMTGVRTLAGYATAANGERLAFALLGNNFDVPGPTVEAAIDACVLRLVGFSR